MILYLVVPISFVITYLFLKWAIPRLKAEEMVGRDVNKPDQPEVAEMGGLGVLLGITLTLSILAAIYSVFNGFDIRIIVLIYSVLLVGLVGIIDDLLDIPKWVKFVLPIIGAIPLITYSSLIDTNITIPMIGTIDLGFLYVFFLLPIMYTGAVNLTNILAGFNGLEYSLAVVNSIFLILVGFMYGKDLITISGLVLLGASTAFLIFNRYPSKVFPGDTGTLIIGGLIVTALILDNFESLAIPIFMLYGLDGIIKILNGLPSKGWWGKYVDGKLYSPDRPVSLPQMIMKLAGGITEQNLVFVIVFAQIIITSVWLVVLAYLKMISGI
ncbi:MAG: hypothetical protein QXE47_01510 [Candidatus Anstonellales archaeon]